MIDINIINKNLDFLQLVSEMASAAGLECAVDPALAAALRNQKTGTSYKYLIKISNI
jgi:hypothetical protein